MGVLCGVGPLRPLYQAQNYVVLKYNNTKLDYLALSDDASVFFSDQNSE